MKHLFHLVKRFNSSWSRKDVTEDELGMVRSVLTASEFNLWNQFSIADRRHSVEVAQRFAVLLPGATREQRAGVLLHDIGKIQSNLSTLMRVCATLVGPRTKRFRLYHQHEEIGITMLRHAGSHADVIAVLNQTCSAEVAAAFRSADNI
jgi:response regulator RpfG family c-di-GMP phosphodiesterase